MPGDAQLLLMIAGMHMLGLVCAGVLLFAAMRDRQAMPPRPSDSDDGGGPGQGRPPRRPDMPTGGIPLDHTEQSRVRLRDHGRLSDGVPRRERRPAREPGRTPARTATGTPRRPADGR